MTPDGTEAKLFINCTTHTRIPQFLKPTYSTEGSTRDICFICSDVREYKDKKGNIYNLIIRLMM
jgi:hypothetical protein